LFRSLPFRAFPVAVVTADFQTANDSWATSNPITNIYGGSWYSKGSDATIAANRSSIYALQHEASTFFRVENLDCMKAYINPLLATSDLILVSDVLTANSANFTQPWYFWDNNTSTVDRGGLNSSLLYGFISGSDHVDWGESTKWVCSDWYKEHYDLYWGAACTSDIAVSLANNWHVFGRPIQYCLLGPAGDNSKLCGLHFSTLIFKVVVTCMVVEAFLVACVAYQGRRPKAEFWGLGPAQKEAERRSSEAETVTGVAKQSDPLLTGEDIAKIEFEMRDDSDKDEPMVTLGDAQAQYLRVPDDWTSPGAVPPSNSKRFAQLSIAKWETTRPFLFHAVGAKMWISTSVLIIVCIIGVGLIYGMSIGTLHYRRLPTSLADLWSYVVGRASGSLMVAGWVGATSNLASHILFVNMFQVRLSVIYLFSISSYT
jgi:hypothetical protein